MSEIYLLLWGDDFSESEILGYSKDKTVLLKNAESHLASYYGHRVELRLTPLDDIKSVATNRTHYTIQAIEHLT